MILVFWEISGIHLGITYPTKVFSSAMIDWIMFIPSRAPYGFSDADANTNATSDLKLTSHTTIDSTKI